MESTISSLPIYGSLDFLPGKGLSADMALNSFLLSSFLLHLGLLLPVTAEKSVYATEGDPVTLPCPDVVPGQKTETVYWKYNGDLVVKYMKGTFWKVRQSDSFKDTVDFSLQMPEAKEGLYSCSVSGQERSIHLRLLKVTGSPEGYFLQGESVELQLHPPDMMPTLIEWTDPHNKRGHQPRWNLMDNNQRLQITNLQVQDNGIWRCSVHGKTISYEVTVIGFLQASDEEIFAAVNSTVTLSYALNLPPKKYSNSSETHFLTQETLGKSVSLRGHGSCPPKTITNVQFEDGGRYQCHIRLDRGWLNKTIHLGVMKVFASPPGPLLQDGDVKLCCNISAPLPPRAQLCWNAGNKSVDGSRCLVGNESTNHSSCLRVPKRGQWVCSLAIEAEVKISVNYTVEEATQRIGFLLAGVVFGAGLPLGLLFLVGVCLFTFIILKRKKRRSERMTQAKQHLLAKRICQCQRDKSNDYYHT
ncbi:T-cell surface glycoprotein CD4 isoform X2 [Paroedura picta]|uniref:T-cell surface glycoprotein CD4 isoform X2 n=1 Tax=Paroedura picta TaxID=143630 RepID=UPI00405626A8